MNMKSINDEILQLNKSVVEKASDDDWIEALELINKRQLCLDDLFSRQKSSITANPQQLNQLLLDIEHTDKKLKQLAADSKTTLSSKIAHLSLSKKASREYQQVAAQ